MFIHMYIFVGLGSWTYVCCIFIFASYVLLVARHCLLHTPRSPTPWRLSGPWCTAVRGRGGVDGFSRTTSKCRWSIYTSGPSRRKAQALSGTAVPELFLCMQTWSLWGAHCVRTLPPSPKHACLVTICNFRMISFSIGKVRSKNEAAQPFQLFFFFFIQKLSLLIFFLATKVL